MSKSFMAEDQRFKSLLNRYLNNVATADEQDELMQLIASGKFDDPVKDSIDANLLQEPAEAYGDMRMERAQEILKNIVSKKEANVVPLRSWNLSVVRWAAAAAIAVTAVAGIWLYGTDQPERQAQQVAEVSNQSSIFSGKQFVKLPDGSTAILNEGSQLTQHAGFGADDRVVTLIGEAFFDIAHDPARPFRVVTGDVTTTVLGTAFNVKAFVGQEVKVTVMRGRVQVANKEKVLGIIIPDQQIAVNTATSEYVQTNTRAEEVVVWKSQYLIFDDISMETAAAIIEEKYNTKVIFVNPEVKKCRITATFLNGEDVDQVLTVISGVLNATYSTQPDGNVRLEGEACQPESN